MREATIALIQGMAQAFGQGLAGFVDKLRNDKAFHASIMFTLNTAPAFQMKTTPQMEQMIYNTINFAVHAMLECERLDVAQMVRELPTEKLTELPLILIQRQGRPKMPENPEQPPAGEAHFPGAAVPSTEDRTEPAGGKPSLELP